jgi:hypothetical protein
MPKDLLVGQAGGLRIGKTLGEPAYRAFACQSEELSSRLAASLFRRRTPKMFFRYAARLRLSD